MFPKTLSQTWKIKEISPNEFLKFYSLLHLDTCKLPLGDYARGSIQAPRASVDSQAVALGPELGVRAGGLQLL